MAPDFDTMNETDVREIIIRPLLGGRSRPDRLDNRFPILNPTMLEVRFPALSEWPLLAQCERREWNYFIDFTLATG